MSAPDENPKPDGKAFDDFFDSIGSKAEQVNSSKATDATKATPVEEEEEQKVVDEIESLCMNCHANVCIRLLLNVMDMFLYYCNRASLDSSSPESLSSAKSSSCPSTAHTAASKTPRFNLPAKSNRRVSTASCDSLLWETSPAKLSRAIRAW